MSTALSPFREYFTHWNNGRPYQVIIDDSKIIINRNTPQNEKIKNYKFLISIDHFINFYVGKDNIPPDEITIPKNIDSSHYEHGNTILVQLEQHKYMYIGKIIYTFEISDEIIDYYSPLRNNDIPYPFAVGTQNIYLLLENVFIEKQYIFNKKDPYNEYYYLRNYLSGANYIQEQNLLKSLHKPYDISIESDEEINFLIDGKFDFDKRIEYAIKKYNLQDKQYDKYKQYKKFMCSVIDDEWFEKSRNLVLDI